MADTETVITWYLEQTSPADLSHARTPDERAGVTVARAEVPSPEFSRFLYTAVGADNSWMDRLPWTYEEWERFLDRPGFETWVAYERGTPAGFVELDGASEPGTVEITSFGLLPAFRGRGIGGHLLSVGAARAWDLAGRWDGHPATTRVWLHTCSRDGRHARANYERRGFRVHREESAREPVTAHPGPWPGA
ncbi:GNAT family N-acetyltransferase [Streptomyces albus subsp. chlorinus]|uniref:GNAT family N-acetyltransferase n=1 Tax=Streptomyces albus TaxID=1888 RepID=UPI001570BCD2|nr:N-acetyltransferase [Streptomyces albus]NSC24502.1 GNAT family N-acetyltransferase [Streptomyces albus subsp. chlorinus]